MSNTTNTTAQITGIAGNTSAAKIELSNCKCEVTNNQYPANVKFLKLQRALIALMGILIFASCNFKSKEDKKLPNTDIAPIQYGALLKKIDSLSFLNRDSLRFSELIKLIELNDLTQCGPLIPVENYLLLRFLNNQNQEIIQHFVKGYMFRFDDGFTKKSMMGLEIYTFDSKHFADQFAEKAFINETKEDPICRVARYANSIYIIYHQTYLYEARIKYKKLVEDWDKIYWDKVY